MPFTRKPPTPEFTEEELIASISYQSYWDFVTEFWDEVVAERLISNWHMELMCDELQMLAEDVMVGCPKEYDLIVNIPPGTTKSTIASVMFPAWVWTRMPSAKFLCGSYAHNLSMDLSRKSRNLVKSQKYQRCFPWVEISEEQDTKEHFVTTAKGERYAFGVGGSVFGKHGHFIIIDDPLNPNEAVSEAMLKSCNHWMQETLPSRKVSLEHTPEILIQQRLHQDDPSGNKLARDGNVRHVCLPAELSEDVNPPELADKYVDGLLDPVRLNRHVLSEAYANIGEYGYAGQYMQRPTPRGGLMFHVDKIKTGKPPRFFKKLVRYWDKAASLNKGKYTVGAKMGLDFDDRYWVLDVKRFQLDTFRREQEIHTTTLLDGPDVMVIFEQEPGSGGKDSAELAVQRMAFKIGRMSYAHKVGKTDGDKETRAVPYSVQVNAGNVWMAEATWNKVYIDEMRYFPKSKFKDQVDASAGAFNKLSRQIEVGGLA